MPLSPRGGLTL